MINPLMTAGFLDGATMQRGRVVRVELDGTVHVEVREREVSHCDVLDTDAQSTARLRPDDGVLVWLPADRGERPVVLGRLTTPGAKRRTARRGVADAPALPDELVIEARKCLTLRVGDGSITIREDGKILIKGKDLVSHAQRMNRIKGGAVSIN